MVIQTCDTFRFQIWLYDFPCDITQFYVTWLIFNRFNGWKFSHFASIRYFRFEFDAYSMNYARNNKYSIYTFKSKSSLELDKLRLLFFFFFSHISKSHGAEKNRYVRLTFFFIFGWLIDIDFLYSIFRKVKYTCKCTWLNTLNISIYFQKFWFIFLF